MVKLLRDTQLLAKIINTLSECIYKKNILLHIIKAFRIFSILQCQEKYLYKSKQIRKERERAFYFTHT